MTLSGLYTPFGDIGAGTLRMLADIYQVSVTQEDFDEQKKLMGTMPAYSDVAPALARLSAAGFQLVTLTNSTADASPTPLENAGLQHFFEHSFSIEAEEQFKPAPDTYRMVARKLSVEASDLCLVACHVWDTIGAQAAGCHGALLKRLHNAVLPAPGVPQPDIVAPDMHALADRFILGA